MEGEEQDKGAVEARKAAFKLEHGNKSLLDMVIRMREVEIVKEDLTAKLAEVNAEYDVLRIDLIPARMEDDGVTNVKYADIGQVVLNGDLFVQVKDKENLFGWLRKKKLGDLIQPGVNAGTLKAFIKRRIVEGKEYPDETVLKVTPYTRASIRKSK